MIRVLVIDDENALRENIFYLLKKNKYEVFCAENGKSGFELAQKIKPDLILCDVLMPQNDGYWVLENVRGDKKLADIPFIFITAKAEANDLRKGMELGADDYLIKPFRIEELINAIEIRLARTNSCL